jgi:hypothetical protein
LRVEPIIIARRYTYPWVSLAGAATAAGAFVLVMIAGRTA